MKIRVQAGTMAAGIAVLALTACHNYVKRDEFDATVAQLRGETASARAESRDQVASLGRDLEGRFKNQDVAITDLQDRVRLDMSAHFDFDQAQLRPEDTQALNEFADVVRKRPDIHVTVEGFADSAGSPAYNKKLGLRRADAVREHLVANGLRADMVNTVSYGSDRSRQLVPGASRTQGQANRRVALVVSPTGNGVSSATDASRLSVGAVDAEQTRGTSH